MQQTLNFGPNLGQKIENLGWNVLGHLFVSKINAHFNQGTRTNKLRAKTIRDLPDLTFGGAHCQTTLCLGFRRKKIGETFRLSQIDSTVQKRASRKLASFGAPQPL